MVLTDHNCREKIKWGKASYELNLITRKISKNRAYILSLLLCIEIRFSRRPIDLNNWMDIEFRVEIFRVVFLSNNRDETRKEIR